MDLSTSLSHDLVRGPIWIRPVIFFEIFYNHPKIRKFFSYFRILKSSENKKKNKVIISKIKVLETSCKV